MKECTWIIQEKLNRKTEEDLILACNALKKPYKLVQIIPFSLELPEFNVEEPFICSGSTTMVGLGQQDPRYKNGIFYSSTTFNMDSYQKAFQDNFLNSDAKTYSVEELASQISNYDLEELVFFKSQNDSKQIPGTVQKFRYLADIVSNTIQYGENYSDGILLNKESKITVAPVKEVFEEYRFIVLEGEILTGSQYVPKIDSNIPNNILKFAQQMAKKHQPADCFVLDVCTGISNKKKGIFVLECNCFNAAGFYASDYKVIVDAVSEYQERVYQQSQQEIIIDKRGRWRITLNPNFWPENKQPLEVNILDVSPLGFQMLNFGIPMTFVHSDIIKAKYFGK